MKIHGGIRAEAGGARLSSGAGLLIPWLAGSVNSLVGATLNELHFYQALVFIPAAVIASIAVHRLIAKPTAQRFLQICVLALLMLYGYLFIGYSRWRSADLVTRTRNFFGVILVQRDRVMTYLIHGATFQGAHIAESHVRGCRRFTTAPTAASACCSRILPSGA